MKSLLVIINSGGDEREGGSTRKKISSSSTIRIEASRDMSAVLYPSLILIPVSFFLSAVNSSYAMPRNQVRHSLYIPLPLSHSALSSHLSIRGEL